jgi:hypothetical protein
MYDGWDGMMPVRKASLMPYLLIAVLVLIGVDQLGIVHVDLLHPEEAFAAQPGHHRRHHRKTRAKQTAPSGTARADIPPRYLAAYRAGARDCPGLSWTWLAGIGKIESNHGQSQLPGVHSGENYAGAGGPMQFLSGTAAQYGLHDRYRIEEAAPAAARLLCANGAPHDMGSAVYAYNHAWWYVAKVTAWKHRYQDRRS